MSEKGDNSVKYLQNFAKSWSGHLHFGHNLWAKYHDPSSSGSSDILFTKSFLSLKRETIQQNFMKS